ncbi:unnamed protein product [Calicophoron daubneyi]|uniref:Serpin domain-containing protein n=1 Tax=Calicophoron daubneyi TaxID=300641 RepID=A0AAV2TW19_CALDB
MSMTEAGSRGDTKKEMVKTLRLPSEMSDEKIHETVGSTLMKCFESVPGVDVALANRLFVLKAATIQKQFTDLLHKYYKSNAEKLDSLGSDEAKRTHINKWVCENTKGKIRELLPPGSFQSDSVITIVNTIYFRGLWREVFKKEITADAPFHKLDGSVQTVKMMRNKEVFPYVKLSEISAQALKIPFKNDDWSLLIILPDENIGLPNLLSHLQKPGAISAILKKEFALEKVSLYLPRFKLGEGSAMDVGGILHSLGMNLVFEKGKADLTGICENQPLFVSAILHKAILEVDEQGATAAAATGTMLLGCALETIKPVEFHVDHPFFVAIVSNNTIPVFMGHDYRYIAENNQLQPTHYVTNQERTLLNTPPDKNYADERCTRTIQQEASSLENVFISPASLWIAMLMLEAGSGGDTKKQMISALRLKTRHLGDEVHRSIGSTVMKCFESVPGVEITLANRLFILQQATIRDSFINLLQSYYKSGSENLQCLSSDEAKRNSINNWVSENTRGKIQQLLPPGTIGPETIMTIINTIYFKGLWRSAFSKEGTSEALFHNLDGSTNTVRMMHNEENFPYLDLDDLDAQALKIPFKNPSWELLIILPKEDGGLPNLLSSLQKPGELSTILDTQFEMEKFSLFLPRFKLGEGSVVDAKALLRSLGMELIFTPGKADLSGISEDHLLAVSEVLHKAVLEVDEQGATAAAATAEVVSFCCLITEEPTIFCVNHPFFVALIYRQSVPIFLGHVATLENL